MKLGLAGISTPSLRREWEAAGYSLPLFDIMKMREKTKSACRWVHFGAGNIFRAFLGARMQELLDKGLADSGIVVGEGFDWEMIDEAYSKFDNLSVVVTLKSDGAVGKTVVGSIAEAWKCSSQRKEEWGRMRDVFRNPLLQMVSFTITEKGYSITPAFVQDDILRGPEGCATICCMVAALLLERYKADGSPIAMVSMDNCSRNGEKLQNAILSIAEKWLELGFVDRGFVDYASNPAKVSFPWSMIDKITSRPDALIRDMLKKDGFAEAEITVTSKNTWIAPFVNTEECEYLVVEDSFPNGRPPLDKAGVYFTDRETVTKVERMKVCTCLNPLHTAMSLMGCLLGYHKISDEMKDPDIVAYIKTLGYKEGLPVVTDPGILSPKEFIDDVVSKRLPNPFLPDTPQRIATDTSQKLAIRFGETVKAYMANPALKLESLKCLPLACASWLRYLLGIDDNGEKFELSPDPMIESVRADMKDVSFGRKLNGGELDNVLSRTEIWGYDLAGSALKAVVVRDFELMNAGKGAVRKTLHEIAGE